MLAFWILVIVDLNFGTFWIELWTWSQPSPLWQNTIGIRVCCLWWILQGSLKLGKILTKGRMVWSKELFYMRQIKSLGRSPSCTLSNPNQNPFFLTIILILMGIYFIPKLAWLFYIQSNLFKLWYCDNSTIMVFRIGPNQLVHPVPYRRGTGTVQADFSVYGLNRTEPDFTGRFGMVQARTAWNQTVQSSSACFFF